MNTQKITVVSTIKFKDFSWMSTSLLYSKAHQITNAKAYVFSDSVLCVGKMGDHLVATWKSKIEWHSEKQSHQGYESNRRDADGVRVENIPRIHSVGPPLQESKSNERPTVWTWALQRHDHLHVNVQRHCMGQKRKYRSMWIQFTDSCGTCSQIPSRPLVFSAFETGELRSKGHGKKSIHFNGSDENIELFLRTVISANQLSVYGAAADLCDEVPKNIRAPGKLAAPQHLEKVEIPTVLSKAENSTNEQQWVNLRQEYEQKIEHLSEDKILPKLCSDAGLKLVETGQYFYTLDTEEGLQMQHLCREYTMPRNEKGTRARWWILKNTKIGPVLNIKVCHRDEKSSIEVQVPSLFQDNTVSWVRIVSGVDRYVTESMPPTKEENTASVKPISKARPRQKPTATLTSVSVPVLERKWIDIETQRSHDHQCYEVSKAMTRLLRHDQSVPRGSDGAIHYSDIIEECRKKEFDDASQWLHEDWISNLAEGGGAKKRFQYCVNPNSSNQFLYLRAIQGHSGGKCYWSCTARQFSDSERIYRVSLSRRERERIEFHTKKWINSRRKKAQERKTSGILRCSEPDGRWTWYGWNSTRSDETKDRAIQEDLETPSKYVFWCNSKLAQEKGLQFYQTRSHAVVLHNTLPAACIEEAVCMKTQDEIYPKVRATCRTKIELAIWSTRSTKPRRKIILGTIKLRNLQQHRGLQNVKTTPQITGFRDVQQTIIMATVWIDDDDTKSDYNQEENLDYVRVVKLSDKTPNTNDDVTTKTITVHLMKTLYLQYSKILRKISTMKTMATV